MPRYCINGAISMKMEMDDTRPKMLKKKGGNQPKSSK
jgi:hypothetical protein